MKAKFYLGTIILVLLAVALSPVSSTMAAGSPQDENPPGQIEPLAVTSGVWLPIALGGDGGSAPPPPPPPSTTIISDEFNSTNWDPIWARIDPIGDSNIRVNGAHARMSFPAGVPHLAWRSGFTSSKSSRIMQTVANPANFTLETKFDIRPKYTYTYQGIRVEHDDNDFIRFEYYSYGPNEIYLFAATIINGVMTDFYNQPVTASMTGSSSYLRLTRSGSSYIISFSGNGTTWTMIPGSFQFAPTVTKVGLYGGTSYPETGAPTDSPPFELAADYFRATGP